MRNTVLSKRPFSCNSDIKSNLVSPPAKWEEANTSSREKNTLTMRMACKFINRECCAHATLRCTALSQLSFATICHLLRNMNLNELHVTRWWQSQAKTPVPNDTKVLVVFGCNISLLFPFIRLFRFSCVCRKYNIPSVSAGVFACVCVVISAIACTLSNNYTLLSTMQTIRMATTHKTIVAIADGRHQCRLIAAAHRLRATVCNGKDVKWKLIIHLRGNYNDNEQMLSLSVSLSASIATPCTAVFNSAPANINPNNKTRRMPVAHRVQVPQKCQFMQILSGTSFLFY